MLLAADVGRRLVSVGTGTNARRLVGVGGRRWRLCSGRFRIFVTTMFWFRLRSVATRRPRQIPRVDEPRGVTTY